MRIFITGDSFAHQNHNEHCWPNILAKKLNANITLKACQGQPLYYCYKQLKKITLDYDFYLILVSGYPRLYINDEIGINLLNFETNKPDRVLHTIPKDLRMSLTHASEQYVEHLMNLDYLHDMHIFTLEKIKFMLSDKQHLLYPCFYPRLSILKTKYFHLSEITQYEDSFIDSREIFSSQIHRLNHLYPDNNEILAEHFSQLITTGSSNITLNDFKPPPKEFWKK